MLVELIPIVYVSGFDELGLMHTPEVRQLHFITLPWLNFFFQKPDFASIFNLFLVYYFSFQMKFIVKRLLNQKNRAVNPYSKKKYYSWISSTF